MGTAFAEDLSRCVSSLVLPTTNVFSRNSAVGGIVTADVMIGEDGGLARLDLNADVWSEGRGRGYISDSRNLQ